MGRVAKLKPQYFGHIGRGSAGQLALTVLEGIMAGLRHQGRPDMDVGWIHPWVGLGWVGSGRKFSPFGGLGWLSLKLEVLPAFVMLQSRQCLLSCKIALSSSDSSNFFPRSNF